MERRSREVPRALAITLSIAAVAASFAVQAPSAPSGEGLNDVRSNGRRPLRPLR